MNQRTDKNCRDKNWCRQKLVRSETRFLFPDTSVMLSVGLRVLVTGNTGSRHRSAFRRYQISSKKTDRIVVDYCSSVGDVTSHIPVLVERCSSSPVFVDVA